MRTEKSQEMKVMRLTRNEDHMKLRTPIRDISYWLVNADVSDFYPPWGVSARKIAPPLRTSTITPASHDYLLPTSSPSLRLLRERPETPCPGLLLRRVTAQKAR
jgi:hypothetical protein